MAGGPDSYRDRFDKSNQCRNQLKSLNDLRPNIQHHQTCFGEPDETATPLQRINERIK